MKKFSIFIGILLLLICGYFLLNGGHYQAKDQEWVLYLYDSKTSGHAPLNVGTFDSEEVCKTAGSQKLSSGFSDPDHPELNGYFCGKNCSLDSEMGSFFLMELNCEQKSMSLPLPEFSN